MPLCVICGEALPDGARTCTVCGSGQPEGGLPVAAVMAPPTVAPPARPSVLSIGEGCRACFSCGKVYGADYTDPFCTCGVELPSGTAVAEEWPAGSIPVSQTPPATGTPCLVLYGPDKQPTHYFSLTRETVLIGRLDAVGGVFPEIDVTQWLDASAARRVSRQHALILRTRGGGFSIRPLAGNTGTQLEADMVAPLHDYSLKPGTRIILGGAVRFKFEMS